jgi:hypothetical protein
MLDTVSTTDWSLVEQPYRELPLAFAATGTSNGRLQMQPNATDVRLDPFVNPQPL